MLDGPTFLRIALRLAARRPGLSVARILTVTVVVSAATAVFAVANVTFLRPLPFPEHDRLVRVYVQPKGTTDLAQAGALFPLAFQHLRDNARQLERIEGIWTLDRAVEGEKEAESVRSGRVSAGFFALLGGRPHAGRFIDAADVVSDAKVAVLSHGFWLRRYGGDPDVVGRRIAVDREAHTIVGVAGREFEPDFTGTELWTPLFVRRGPNAPAFSAVQTIARLRPGVPGTAAVAELDRLLAELHAELPSLEAVDAGIVDLRRANFGALRPALLMLLAAVASLALLAAANLANLTLADLGSRRNDFAVAVALGASRLHVAGPEIVLSLGLALGGGVLGLAASAALAPALLSLDPASPLEARLVFLDWRVALAAFGLALSVMLVAIAAPVLRVAAAALPAAMSAGGRSSTGGPRAERTRLVLVAAQTTLALLLLSSGALIVRGLQLTADQAPGFDPSNVVTAQLQLSPSALPRPADRAAFVDRVLERLRTVPGVVTAATTLNPFRPGQGVTTSVEIFGRPSPNGLPHDVQYRRVSPGYFATMRIALAVGREFDRHDDVGSRPVAVVSRSFARRFWPGEDPLGQRIKRGPTHAPWSIVVGVAEDVRDRGLHQAPVATLYTPYFQGNSPATPVGLVVRTKGDPVSYVAAVKQAVWDVDPGQPLASVATLEGFLGSSLGPQRQRAILVGACGGLGLLLAIVGVYGVTARSVGERRRETGIRLALGGRPVDVWLRLAWGSVKAIVAGAALGLVVSAAASAGILALLPEIPAAGWAYAVPTAAGLVAAGAAAAMVAARGAVALDPAHALRSE
jgi:predicted permease